MSGGYRTSLGTSDLDRIRLLGQDLTADLMGEVSFGDLAFWLVALRQPTPGESRLFNAVLVALADHGFTPTVIAARMTLTSAPESIQGAMASGLLGGGSRFLGVTEDTAQLLGDGLRAGALPSHRRGRLRQTRPGDARRLQTQWPDCAWPPPGAQARRPAHAGHLPDRRGRRPARSASDPAGRGRDRAGAPGGAR